MDLRFSQCSDNLVKVFHSRIDELLNLEDSIEHCQKEYFIREESDWKQCADELERVLESRSIPFNKIKW